LETLDSVSTNSTVPFKKGDGSEISDEESKIIEAFTDMMSSTTELVTKTDSESTTDEISLSTTDETLSTTADAISTTDDAISTSAEPTTTTEKTPDPGSTGKTTENVETSPPEMSTETTTEEYLDPNYHLPTWALVMITICISFAAILTVLGLLRKYLARFVITNGLTNHSQW